jgi:hypothetical protein
MDTKYFEQAKQEYMDEHFVRDDVVNILSVLSKILQRAQELKDSDQTNMRGAGWRTDSTGTV